MPIFSNSTNMSCYDHEGYQIESDDEVSAPATTRLPTKYPLSPKVTARPPPEPDVPHSSSSPTLSSVTDEDGEFSGSLSVGTSRSVPSIPSVDTPPSRLSLRERRRGSKKSTTTDDRTTVSEPSNPKHEDSDSTHSEQSPLVDDVVINQSDDEPATVEGFACFGKIMGGFAGVLVAIAVYLVAKSLWNSEPEMPEGFISNTTIVFNSDVDMA